ncbi:hypothetical protein ABT010_38325 [Streptomyces sp. NPDC002668]
MNSVELTDAVEDFGRLEDWALSGRQGHMDPKQSEAFAEFLARQPPVGEQ